MLKILNKELTVTPPSLTRRVITWLTLIAYLGQPLVVTAQIVAAPNAPASTRPVIDTTANGIPMVQIAAPNSTGLSHNQFSLYNVDPNGVILNNSNTTVLTQQAGYVSGNQNMANGSAHIILNEVTSTSASQLNGYTEVAGSRAEVIIANPNGITCNGCGFINTSRSVLTTGAPVFGGSGSLDAFRVTGGQIRVDAGGLNGNNIDQLDLIARSVKVNGNLWANNLNVVTGANQVNYANLGVQIITGSGNKPTVGIDVAQLGGMYANKIRLVGTEDGVGVNSLGSIAAQAGGFNLDNQGQITLASSTSASGNIIINGAIGTTNSGTLYSQQAVHITDQGTITNSGILSAQGNLNLNAANIDSTGMLGAGIASNGVATQNGILTLTATNAGSITNAGMINGSTVTSFSNIFTNTGAVIGDNINPNANTLTNVGANAIIAATQSVNLLIQDALLNQDGANIYSLGDVNIGANLAQDANGYLIGNTGSVTNSSANIEAGGNLRIGATTLTNQRTVVGLEYGPSWTGTHVVGTPGYNSLGTPSYTPTYDQQQFTAATTGNAQLLSGANMWFSGGTLNNDYSSIIAAGAIYGAVNNNGPALQLRETRIGQYNDFSVVYVPQSGSCGYISVNCVPAHTVNIPVKTSYAKVLPSPISGLNYTRLASSPSAYSAATGLNALTTSPPGSTTPLGATINVPASGLYSIHNQPGQQYLVVTDPRFTSYQNFISSDYMLSRLALDPNLIQKRLGDGFYEQQLVTDQITQLTGRRFLGQYANAEEQFKALMDSGIATAKSFNLIPGVELTAAQVAALTSDIVWMVEETVKLPDGGTTKVLAPQIYLSQLHGGDIQSGGAVIAAKSIDLKSGGTLANSGTIRSDDATTLVANDILNQGGTISSGGTVNLQAVNDIVNLSGTIAGNNGSLAAGRDIVNARTAKETSYTVALAPAYRVGRFGTAEAGITGTSRGAELGMEAGIMATNGLSLVAGRNISIVGATVKAGGDASLYAGGNIAAGVLATQLNASGTYNSYINTVTNLTSQIDAGGNLAMQSGNDLQLTATQVNAGNNLALVAGGNIDLKAVKDSTASGFNTGISQEKRLDETVIGASLNTGNNLSVVAGVGRSDSNLGPGNLTLEAARLTSQNGSTNLAASGNIDLKTAIEQHNAYDETHVSSSGMFSSSSTTTISQSNETQAIGSSVSGDRVAIGSGQDTNIKGSSVAGTHDVSLNAGRDINIKASTSSYSQSYYNHTEESGLMSGGGIGFSIGNRSQTDQTSADGVLQSQNRSLVGSILGNLSLTAGNDAHVSGSDLTAANDLSVTGNNITLDTGMDKSIAAQSHDSKQSGLTVALTSSVTDAGQTVQQVKQAGSQTKDDRTKMLAAVAATMAISNAVSGGLNATISATVGSSQSHSDSTQTSLLASGSSLNADGNLSLTAAGGGKDSNLTIQGSKVQAAGDINLIADNAINLIAEQNTASQISHNNSSSSGAGVAASYGSGGGSIGITANAASARGNADGNDVTYTNTRVSAGNTLKIGSGGDANLKGAVAKGNQIIANVGGNLNIASLQDTSGYQSQQHSADASFIVPIVGSGSASVNVSKSKINSTYASVSEQSGFKAGDGGYDVNVAGDTSLVGGVIAASDNALANGNTKFNSGGTLSMTGLQNQAAYQADSMAVSIGMGSNLRTGGGTGSDSGNAQGITRSGIGVSTQSDAGAIKPIFNADQVQKEINAQTIITQVFSQQASATVGSYVQNQRKILMGSIKNATPTEEKQIQEQLQSLANQERVMNVLIGAVAGVGGEAVTKEALSAAADEMRQIMIEDSRKFAGVTDKDGKTLSNVSGPSEGVRGDGVKIGGTRVDLDLLCGVDNSRCEIKRNQDSAPILDDKGRTQLDLKNGQVQYIGSLKDFLKTEDGKKMAGATGGVQGATGTLFGVPYLPGSWQDKLIEAFSGTHDLIGGKLSGLYDEQGNTKRGMTDTERKTYDYAVAPAAIVPSAPFAAAVGLPPEVWNAIAILLKSAK